MQRRKAGSNTTDQQEARLDRLDGRRVALVVLALQQILNETKQSHTEPSLKNEGNKASQKHKPGARIHSLADRVETRRHGERLLQLLRFVAELLPDAVVQTLKEPGPPQTTK